MTAYSEMAAVYDRLMDDFDYPAWADYYRQLLSSAEKDVHTVCECACGTGLMTVELARFGYEVLASDISGEMLEVAGQRTRREGFPVRLVRADMCELRVPRPVDAVVCACDGVNYLTSPARVERFLASAYQALRPGGVLAFDISSPYKLCSYLGDNFFYEDREDVTWLWENRRTGEIVDMNFVFFVRNAGGLYEKRSEQHRQRAHDPRELVRLLEKNGFTRIRVYGDQTFDAPGPEEMRIHFCAVREEKTGVAKNVES